MIDPICLPEIPHNLAKRRGTNLFSLVMTNRAKAFHRYCTDGCKNRYRYACTQLESSLASKHPRPKGHRTARSCRQQQALIARRPFLRCIS
jgi:hypothetical protein